ncbi:MAG: autotransporter outer membrane beta-barrel domain-containing protein [Thiobacillus sp.]|nr:autotransporter outer membrane beta-barrel domain-containing protein [Thiobacillus sp.]MDP3126014.1 autotransporter outer membrane beta-barrel domain-containing protein [Thiobacillus sp.]
MKPISPIRLTALAAATLMAPYALAANPAFQDTVTTAAAGICANFPTSPVCVQSNLSGASEDSLAPTQSLASNDAVLDQARKLAQDEPSGGKLEIGPFSLLLNGRASWFERDSSTLERGYDGDAYSVQLGLDKRLSSHTVVGGFLVYERSRSEFASDLAGLSAQSSEGKSDADTLSLLVFGAHNLSDALYVEAAAGYGWSDYEFNRSVYYQPTGGGALIPVNTAGETDGSNYWLSLGSGYELASGASSLVPYARLTYARSTVDGYSETELTATGLAMRYGDADRSSLTTALGLRAGMTQSYGWGVLVPFFKLEYEHEFKNDPQEVSTAFVLDDANTIFTPAGQEPDRNYFHLGAGTQFILPHGWMSFIEVEALMGHSELERNRLLLGLRKEL